jgi:hypothetical protein
MAVAVFSVPRSKVAPPATVVKVEALGGGDDCVAAFEPKVNGPPKVAPNSNVAPFSFPSPEYAPPASPVKVDVVGV